MDANVPSTVGSRRNINSKRCHCSMRVSHLTDYKILNK